MTRVYYFEIDPLPSNNAYVTRLAKKKGKNIPIRYLNNYHRNWKTAVRNLLRLQDIEVDLSELKETKTLSVDIWLYWEESEFFTKAGKLTRKDASGHSKLLEDCLAEHYDIDDRYNLDVLLHKRPSNYNHIWLIVKSVKLDEHLQGVQIEED